MKGCVIIFVMKCEEMKVYTDMLQWMKLHMNEEYVTAIKEIYNKKELIIPLRSQYFAPRACFSNTL